MNNLEFDLNKVLSKLVTGAIVIVMVRKVALSILLLFSSLFLAGCSLKKTPAAIQITSSPTANVFIDGKSLGKTPLEVKDLKEGEVSLKLIPESASTDLLPWETKIKLYAGVLTLVERNFAASETAASGQILSLEKLRDPNASSISIISDPDGALVKFDGELKGFSPIALDGIALGDHEIIISKEGFLEKKIKARNVAGYRLIINVKLSTGAAPAAEITVTPTVKTTVTPTVKTTPVPKTTTTPGDGSNKGTSVVINETPTGWLRVRSGASTSAGEVARVNPGEKYSLLEEKSGWYKIEYEKDKQGWISSQYAKKE